MFQIKFIEEHKQDNLSKYFFEQNSDSKGQKKVFKYLHAPMDRGLDDLLAELGLPNFFSGLRSYIVKFTLTVLF